LRDFKRRGRAGREESEGTDDGIHICRLRHCRLRLQEWNSERTMNETPQQYRVPRVDTFMMTPQSDWCSCQALL